MITDTLRRDLPSGAVTFLFTDVEGSTKLLHRLGAEAYAETLAEHRRIVRDGCAARGGVEVDTQGDAFFVAFPTASEALGAAQAITEELASGPIALRIGLHTGTPLLTEEGYVGEDVHFAARVAASAHGGQVVLSQATRALLDEHYPLVELGEHRLKDIPDPVAIYQVGDRQFPPLKTISNTNLPRPASSFVGRERELQEVLVRLENGARLLTLTGPGGSGKTRLGVEAAATLVPEYKAGVFWVGLASLRDAALVTETIAQTLGAKDGLAEHIGAREMLLLLDNLEQVIEAAPELSSLLQGCPNLTLLVTSRELLRVQGEVEYPVPPLAEVEAVSLFCERSQAEASEEIAELCGRLDNLPLAVELAAARARALSPGQILERLSQRLDLLKGGRDAEVRQRTLRATIAWSSDLLTEEERRLFRRLAVFAGGCTLAAAEEVAEADLDALQSLVEKSLLRFTNERYWMLETIREFAAEELERAHEQSVRERHARWYARELSRREAAIRDDEVEAVRFIQSELDNARAALGHALEQRCGSDAALLLWGTFRTWLQSGRGFEGAHWANAALEADIQVDGVERVCLLSALGELLRHTTDYARARSLKEEALAAARPLVGQTLPGGRSVAAILVSFESDLADLGLKGGDIEAARAYSDAALRAARAGSDPRALARALGSAGPVAFAAGEIERALALATEGLELDIRAGRVTDAADGLSLISLCQLQLGDTHGAAASLADAIECVRAHPGRAFTLTSLFLAAGRLALARGELQAADALIRLTTKVADDQGLVLEPALAPILVETQQALATTREAKPSAQFASEDDALEFAANLADAAKTARP
jgi:predicted ATPase/class 3 adenylate cyclase